MRQCDYRTQERPLWTVPLTRSDPLWLSYRSVRRPTVLRGWLRSRLPRLSRSVIPGCCLAASLGSLSGCKDLTSTPGLPAGTPSPTYYNTRTGAIGMRNAAVLAFEVALTQYIRDAGLLTDELEDIQTGASTGVILQASGVIDTLDERILPELPNGAAQSNGNTGDYQNLNNVRAAANQAIGALATYDTAATDTAAAKVLRGELYALEGYTEILLADFFCSGVPLSTLDFQQNFTYHPSSSSADIYHDAIAKFDTALALAKGRSDSVMYLAQVEEGRAWLALGNYQAAADDVTTVPDGFIYRSRAMFSGNPHDPMIVSDREGGNGLPFISGGDSRTAIVTIGPPNAVINGNTYANFLPLTVPAKYGPAAYLSLGGVPVTIASGVEARLIQAEFQLQSVLTAPGPSNFPWLTTLNSMRESIQLPDTTDPGTAAGRVALLFRERAFWLFVDGHRQGDLRRLLRQYSPYYETQAAVYPSGPYLAPGVGVYGTDVTVPIPPTEYANPYYHGCLDRRP